MFTRIPQEMREAVRWLLWRRETRNDKPTKVPYSAKTGHKADVTNPLDWSTFDDVLATYEAFAARGEHGYHGIGFVLGGGFAGADFDASDDPQVIAYQDHWIRALASYTERSPSGKGFHVIFKAVILKGRRSQDVKAEIYGDARFFTMTGDVVWDVPIAERQDVANSMIMSFPARSALEAGPAESQAQTDDDAVVYRLAAMAANGAKFEALYRGDFKEWYDSQSEADYALINIIGFYTRNFPQIARMFRASALGQRDKAKRDDYVDRMVQMSQDRQGTALPYEEAAQAASRLFAAGMAKKQQAALPAPTPEPEPAPAPIAEPAPPSQEVLEAEGNEEWPPGLVGWLAYQIFITRPRPIKKLCIAAAVLFMAGFTGRQFNISGDQGLNLYSILIGRSGIGKDFLHTAIDQLMARLAKGGPGTGRGVRAPIQSVYQFRGPSDFGSGAGLNRALQKNPCCLVIAGELGMRMKLMASPKASTSEKQLEKNLLMVYSKSGQHSMWMPTSYSDTAKGGDPIEAPALSFIGESTPENFYTGINDEMIASGLLGRMLVIPFEGKREYLNYDNIVRPWDEGFLEQMASLVQQMLSWQQTGHVEHIRFTPEADAYSRQLDRDFTDAFNASENNSAAALYSRVHMHIIKVAGLIAVGNYAVGNAPVDPATHARVPTVTMDDMRWAYDWVMDQTKDLIRKFDRGETGEEDSEHRQLARVRECVRRYMTADAAFIAAQKCNPGLQAAGIIPLAFLQRLLYNVSGFRRDRMGPKFAITRALQVLIEQGSIQKVPDRDMADKFKSSQIAYLIVRPQDFSD